MSDVENAAIEALAASVGIEPNFRDTEGRIQHVSIDTKHAILSSMGFDVGSPSAIRSTWQARAEAEWHHPLPPIVVLRRRPNTVPSVTLTVPEVLRSRPVKWHLELEGGKTLAGAVVPKSLDPALSSTTSDKLVHVQLPLPTIPDDGYHKLTVVTDCSEMVTTLVVCPPTAFLPDWVATGERRWGIVCQLSSLYSDRSWGIGDFSDLAVLIRNARELGASIVGLNPLHAPLPGTFSDLNPYLPSSRLFLDPAYIDVATIPTPADGHHFRSPLADERLRAQLARARAATLLNYPLVCKIKHTALEAIYRSRRWEDLTVDARDADGTRPIGLRDFRQSRGEPLTRFALFNALQEQFGPLPWRRWPSEVRAPSSVGIATFVKEHRDCIDYHIWLQWIADQQLAAATKLVRGSEAAGLYCDLAVGVNPNGAEAWADAEIYVSDASVGAPPDPFNPNGQEWGMTPPNPLALREQGYAPFIAALRANMRHATVLRVDHVMGLQRLFWIPSGHGAGSGAYVRYPIDDMLGILALESWRHACLIVGEDLGTLPDGFQERMAEEKLFSYRLMMFERYPNGQYRQPSTYPQLAATTFGTHDLPTIRSWWEGRDIELRRRIGVYGPNEAERERYHRQDECIFLLAALRDQQLIADEVIATKDLDLPAIMELIVSIEQFLARSPSALMLASLTDMLAEAVQINVPGTILEHPNWGHRLRRPVSTLGTDPLIRRIAQAIATERPGARRQPEPAVPAKGEAAGSSNRMISTSLTRSLSSPT